MQPTPPQTHIDQYQAEDQILSGATIRTKQSGYTGTGYVGGMKSKGFYIEFRNVDGGSGGTCLLNFRYAHGDSAARPCGIKVNGNDAGDVTFLPTAGWGDWQYDSIRVPCNAGSNNTIRVIVLTSQGGPLIDAMEVAATVSTTPTMQPTPPQTHIDQYQAEDQILSGATIRTKQSGYTGTGYVGGMKSKGFYIEFRNVDGGSGGTCLLNFRYAHGDSAARPCGIKVNGNDAGDVTFLPTAGWGDWQYDSIRVPCNAGSNNTIRVIVSTSQGGPLIDAMEVAAAASLEI